MQNLLDRLAGIRKSITAAVGLATEAVQIGLVTGGAANWVSAVIAVLTVLGVYAVPNAQRK